MASKQIYICCEIESWHFKYQLEKLGDSIYKAGWLLEFYFPFILPARPDRQNVFSNQPFDLHWRLPGKLTQKLMAYMDSHGKVHLVCVYPVDALRYHHMSGNNFTEII